VHRASGTFAIPLREVGTTLAGSWKTCINDNEAPRLSGPENTRVAQNALASLKHISRIIPNRNYSIWYYGQIF